MERLLQSVEASTRLREVVLEGDLDFASSGSKFDGVMNQNPYHLLQPVSISQKTTPAA